MLSLFSQSPIAALSWIAEPIVRMVQRYNLDPP